MASRNTTVKKPKIFTHEGGVAKHINAEQMLRRSVMSCMLWESEFYEDGESIAERIAALVPQVKPEIVEEIAIEAKHKMKLRHVPLWLTVLLCGEGYNVRKLVPQVITRADDFAELLSLYWLDKKKPLAKSLQRGLADAFKKTVERKGKTVSMFDEYALAKYRGDKKKVKLKDVIKLVRPKPDTKKQSNLWKKLIEGTLKTPDTWEVAYSEAKNDEDKKAVWTRLVKEDKLGGLAVLRNIRNMEKVGYDAKKAIKTIKTTRLLPINFLKAAEVNSKYEPEIEEKFMEMFANKEKYKGKTLLLVDVSGSMQGPSEARVGGLAMIAREFFSDIEVFIFGNTVRQVPARRGFALRDAVRNKNEGTELGNAVQHMNNLGYDRLIVVTDEQTRDKVPDPIGKKAYMINIASNKNGVGYGKWIHLDGFSDKILDYIVEYESR